MGTLVPRILVPFQPTTCWRTACSMPSSVEVTHLLNADAVSYASLLAHPVLGQVVFAANLLRSADLTQQGSPRYVNPQT